MGEGVHNVRLCVYSRVSVCLMGVCVSERKVHVDMDSARVNTVGVNVLECECVRKVYG